SVKRPVYNPYVSFSQAFFEQDSLFCDLKSSYFVISILFVFLFFCN
ncbi:unnamed protein product, partial [Amoebophrya sp. A120]